MRRDGEFAITLHPLGGGALNTTEGVMLHDPSACPSSVTVCEPSVRLNTLIVITVLDDFDTIGDLVRVNEPPETLPDSMISVRYAFATGHVEINGTATCAEGTTSWHCDLQLEPGWQTILITTDGFSTESQRFTLYLKSLPNDLVWGFMPQ